VGHSNWNGHILPLVACRLVPSDQLVSRFRERLGVKKFQSKSGNRKGRTWAGESQIPFSPLAPDKR
jgi:hypothetical protein